MERGMHPLPTGCLDCWPAFAAGAVLRPRRTGSTIRVFSRHQGRRPLAAARPYRAVAGGEAVRVTIALVRPPAAPSAGRAYGGSP